MDFEEFLKISPTRTKGDWREFRPKTLHSYTNNYWGGGEGGIIGLFWPTNLAEVLQTEIFYQVWRKLVENVDFFQRRV